MTSQPSRSSSVFNSIPVPRSATGSTQKTDPPPASRQLCDLLQETVADVFDVEAVQVRLATRGRANVALARQVAMYIAHVGCRRSLTEVGELFDRDRTTVSHACAVVELKRDEPGFDEAIRLLEQVIRVIEGAGLSGPPRRFEPPPVRKLHEAS